jgi:hypothetical protein
MTMSKKQKKATTNNGTASKPKRVRAEKPKAEKKISVKTIVRDAFLANPAITNDEVVAAVKKARPDSAFGDKQAQWYRWMAKKGILTGTAIVMPKKTRNK